MIKTGLKNYFINLKHFFTPIGTLAVGIFLGLSILIPGGIAIIGALIDRLSEIVSGSSVDFVAVKDYIANTIRALDWSDPIEALKIMFNREWLTNVLNECLNVIASGLQPSADAINEVVAAAVTGIYLLFAMFILLAVLGLVCGYFLTRFLVRRTMAKRTFKKFIFAVLIDSVVTAGLISMCFWLLTVWEPSIYITSVLSLFIFGGVALLSAYLVHGRTLVTFKAVFNFANLMKLLLTNFLIFIISVTFFVLTVILTNALAGPLIGFSFIEIAFIVISMNAEGYVVELVSKSGKKAEEPPVEEAVEGAA